MTFTIRRSILVVLVCLVVVAGGVFVAQRASAASATPVVYVATGENFPDALGAASAAAVQGGPVLLVQNTSIPAATAGELSRLKPDVIYVAGGSDVVSDGVYNQLKAYAPTVVRVEGRTRYETAVEVSKSAFPVTASVGGGDADTLDGKDSTAFALSGHNHDGTYLAKTGKAADANKLDGKDSTEFATKSGGIVNAAEVKIRHASESASFDVDVLGSGDVHVCETAPLAVDTETTFVYSGAMQIHPLGSTTTGLEFHMEVSSDGGAAHDEMGPNSSAGPSWAQIPSTPFDYVVTLPAGTYTFSIGVFGLDDNRVGNDWGLHCGVTITAYAGQGAATDVVIIDNS